MNAIEIQSLKKVYDTNVEALKGINLAIPKGSFFGLLGPNGAGKTTTIGILTGLVNKTSGSAKILNYDIIDGFDSYGHILKYRDVMTNDERNPKVLLSKKVNEFDYLVAADGIYSKTKQILFKKAGLPEYFETIALRGTIRDFDCFDISLYLGPNFHFVIYPINQNKEFNFIAIIRKKFYGKKKHKK